MGGQHGVGLIPQWVIGGQGLLFKYVQCGPGQMTTLQGGQQGVGANDGAAADVHQDRPGFHALELRLIE